MKAIGARHFTLQRNRRMVDRGRPASHVPGLRQKPCADRLSSRDPNGPKEIRNESVNRRPGFRSGRFDGDVRRGGRPDRSRAEAGVQVREVLWRGQGRQERLPNDRLVLRRYVEARQPGRRLGLRSGGHLRQARWRQSRTEKIVIAPAGRERRSWYLPLSPVTSDGWESASDPRISPS